MDKIHSEGKSTSFVHKKLDMSTQIEGTKNILQSPKLIKCPNNNKTRMTNIIKEDTPFKAKIQESYDDNTDEPRKKKNVTMIDLMKNYKILIYQILPVICL